MVEAVESFQLQTPYPGWIFELVIFNTLEAIDYEFHHPCVHIFNEKVRPNSLGETRNLAIAKSTGEILVTWDSDDLYLPHYLQTFANHFDANPNAGWVWQNKQFYAEGGVIKKVTNGTFNTVAFTRDAWEKAGRYTEKSVGEDRDFVARLTSANDGVKAHILPSEAGFVYCWGNGVHHISGKGEDKPGRVSAWDEAKAVVDRQIRNGTLATGAIPIYPSWQRDYATEAKRYLEASGLIGQQKIEGTGCVLLGKFGDVINALPILKRLHDDGQNPHLVVAREFASVLAGVSYAKPFPLDIGFDRLGEAMEIAETRFTKTLRLQIYGKGHRQEKLTPSYNMETWREAGMLGKFNSCDMPLVFDRRDKKRESELLTKLFVTSKPKIVTNLTNAGTAPFARGASVLRLVQREFSKTHEVVDIGRLKLERIYDLVGVIEAAEVFVSIDTATLHLAAATEVPIVALINDVPWVGSEVRLNCYERIRYRDASPERVITAIGNVVRNKGKIVSDRNGLSAVASPPVVDPKRKKLEGVALWACCWSEDRENYIRTLRVLRYCQTLFQFDKVILFAYLPPVIPIGFELELYQIPKLDMEQWNIFHNRIVPKFIDSPYALSVHEDGFPLDASLWRDEFLSYDYIGAAWADGVVGNGGFTLESRKMLQAKLHLPFSASPHMASDYFTCRHHRDLLKRNGIKFAPPHVAADFSAEQRGHLFPCFGFHGRRDQPEKYRLAWEKIVASERK